MTTDTLPARRNVADSSLRLSAILLLAGQVLFILVTQLHAGGDANEHRSIFATYAHSGDWVGVHAFQFLAVAITVAGLVALSHAVEARVQRPVWAARIGAVLAVVSLALYGVLQAVDGVGNKQVDHAWVTAADADRSARFASAEAMRWLEWGMSSYHAYALGLALVAFAVAMAAAGADVPRAIASLTGLSGIAWLAEGWVAGAQGFTGTHSVLIVASWVLSLAWMTSLLVIARRAAHADAARTGRDARR